MPQKINKHTTYFVFSSSFSNFGGIHKAINYEKENVLIMNINIHKSM